MGVRKERKSTFLTAFKAMSAKSTVTPLLTLGGSSVKSVNHYKYLGVVLDTELPDDKDIQRQLRYQYCAAKKVASLFSFAAVENNSMRFCISLTHIKYTVLGKMP